MSNSATLNSISKSFGSVQALHNLDLTVGAGQFVALLGPSGCGKTTLLRLIAGFETPSSGEIWIRDQRVAAEGRSLPPEQRRIGMVFQSFALWPHMTVLQNVAFPLRHQSDVPPAYRDNPEARVREVLEIVGLGGYEHRYPGQLSGGQRQRVALARAIVFEPLLLLMDEPLSSLDADLRMQMRKEIQEIHRELGTSIVYVTHDQSEALAMADRIVVMKEGRIEQEGTPEAIYYQPQTSFVAKFVGRANFLQGHWSDPQTFIFPVDDGLGVSLRPRIDVHSFREQGVLPVRPEQIRLFREADDVQTERPLVGTVEHVQFQGKELLYSVRVGQTVLEVAAGVGERFSRGQTVAVSFDL
ncbi:ABC transporter ATP-binding protein [Brevibacillus humidisoli]|uniref:ABC transporter ATP-binding protein n=1 Tax=Brevibacillus humidisoli TaxID=2895522 RepID=UPI001E61D502|nr:ABC transporter ATP-binding protein [Brevibacillus humidisoli]UFJ38911.1 ABC transporter ATP-binding protein [Brevibacillus humidisoli]